jgi:hypothetical protein
MKQVKNQVYLTEGGLPIDPGRTTMGEYHHGGRVNEQGTSNVWFSLKLVNLVRVCAKVLMWVGVTAEVTSGETS